MAEPTRRHPLDVLSLILGLALLAVAGTVLLTDLTSTELDLRWFGPALLIAAGVAGLAASTRRD